MRLFRFALFFLCLPIKVLFAEGPVVLIAGTRPEIIKMSPVYAELKKENVPVVFCLTGQHANIGKEVLSLFDIQPEYDLNIMKPGQDLFYVTEVVMQKTKELFESIRPALVVVQGDTTSAMAAALSAFYLNIPVMHVEAGLRSGNIRGPFPEELNRRIITLVSSFHFAPTRHAFSQLVEHEAVEEKQVLCTGNTVIDAMHLIKERIAKGELAISPEFKNAISSQKEQGRKILLLTAHRRESFDGGLDAIFSAMKAALQKHPELFIVYPTHPNPAVQMALDRSGLKSSERILVVPPLPYHELLYALDAADFVATDSGGIQEEGSSLGKKIIVLRNETDRPECLKDGSAVLVGSDKKKILAEIAKALKSSKAVSKNKSYYGDGRASERIASLIQQRLKHEKDHCAIVDTPPATNSGEGRRG